MGKWVQNSLRKIQTLTFFNLETDKMTRWKDKMEIAEELFPKDEKETWLRQETVKEEIPQFRMEELVEAFQRLRNKKAPGTDGLSGEVVKMFFETAPNFCLKFFKYLLVSGTFPKIWKTGKLGLLENEGTGKMSYRPICLLNVMGKVLENLLKRRILELKKKGDLSENQHGFREGRSTIDAIEQVV